MIVAFPALLGLEKLEWMHRSAFPGEVLLGALVVAASLLFLTPTEVATNANEAKRNKQSRNDRKPRAPHRTKASPNCMRGGFH